LKRNVAAFLNIKVDGSMDLARHPLDQDRVDASHKFVLVSTEGKLNGKQLYPHELVRDLSGHGDVAKQFIAKSLWPKVVQNVINQIQERRKELSELQAQDAAELLGGMGVQPGNILCMSDVSASMTGEPMHVSIALGILCSEIASPAFKDLVMTFSERPTLISLADCEGDIMRKVSKVRDMHWGMSTDFHKAMECIVTIVLEKKLTQSEIPTLLVVSDMQFNEASATGNKTQEAHRLIEQRFAQIGKELHGTPLLPPTIVYWNVRSATVGFPAKANVPGVVLMSGFSPALLKFVFSGEIETTDIEVDEDTGVVDIVQRKLTAEEMLVKVLSEKGLAPVRERLDKMPPCYFLPPQATSVTESA
jgi:hypothetical protein